MGTPPYLIGGPFDPPPIRGSNADIMRLLSKGLGFQLNLTRARAFGQFDKMNQTWNGMMGDVRKIVLVH